MVDTPFSQAQSGEIDSSVNNAFKHKDESLIGVQPTIERKKNDFSDCDFIFKTLSVCDNINLALESLKSEIKTKFKTNRKGHVLDEKAEFKIFQSPSFIISTNQQTQNGVGDRHAQGFWKRYSGQKMAPRAKKLALDFEASKSLDSFAAAQIVSSEENIEFSETVRNLNLNSSNLVFNCLLAFIAG